jgi:hypothetical protein
MGVSQQYGHAVADAEGGVGEEGHTAGRDPQLEAADRAAAAAHAAEVAEYELVHIGTANILVIHSADSGAAGPLMSAATRLGFEVKTSVAWLESSFQATFMWTLQRAGGGLSNDLQHQLRKAIALAHKHKSYMRVICS